MFEDIEYRVIAQTTIGDCFISTVWTGISVAAYRPVAIFETMIFAEGRKLDQIQWRYNSQGEAVHGHLFICSIVSGSIVRQLV
jgi:hypothetical protein